MQTPGQLVRQHRTRRAWSQRELAEYAGFTQSMIGRFENERVMPTWDQLCRLLAPMGVQPTVLSEECDLTVHAATRGARMAWDEWTMLPVSTWSERWPEVEPDRVVCPDLQREDLSSWDVGPISCFLDGLDAVVVGPFALRLHGYPCTVSSVAVDLYGAEPGEPLVDVADLLARKARHQGLELWSPEAMRFLAGAPPHIVKDCITRTGGNLRLRTIDTGTAVELTFRSGDQPPYVRSQYHDWEFKVLSLGEFDPTQTWVQRVVRAWVGHDHGSWPGGPDRQR